MVQPFWKTIWWLFFKRLNIELPYDPAISLPRKMKSRFHTKSCTSVFIVTLFIIAQKWKIHSIVHKMLNRSIKCDISMQQNINYFTIKAERLKHGTKWMNLENTEILKIQQASLGVWMPLLMSSRSSSLFPSQEGLAKSGPPWASDRRAKIHPCSSRQSSHCILQSSAWAWGRGCPSTHRDPLWDVLQLLLWEPHLFSGGCCQAFPVLWLGFTMSASLCGGEGWREGDIMLLASWLFHRHHLVNHTFVK